MGSGLRAEQLRVPSRLLRSRCDRGDPQRRLPQPKFVLDADIAKCFDRIDHAALLAKLATSSSFRRAIRPGYKPGDGWWELFPTTQGTPQGGVISPQRTSPCMASKRRSSRPSHNGHPRPGGNAGCRSSCATPTTSWSFIRTAVIDRAAAGSGVVSRAGAGTETEQDPHCSHPA